MTTTTYAADRSALLIVGPLQRFYELLRPVFGKRLHFG
jgi:hypothetical protein